MLQQIIIKGLFNRFNYNIELKKERLTVLTGPNGYGKTTILKILESFSSKNLMFFFQLPFSEISLITQNKTITISKSNELLEIIAEGEQAILLKKQELFHKDLKHFIEREGFTKINEDLWHDSRTGQVYSTDLLINKFGDIFPVSRLQNEKKRVPPFVDVYFIREQRLFRTLTKNNIPESPMPLIRYETRNDFISVIEAYARALSSMMKDVLANASQVGQNLDSSFPQRLFDEKNLITEKEFQVRFNRMNEKQKLLSIYGLSTIKRESPTTFKEENAKVLLVYLNDIEKKLAVFDDLLRKLDLFSMILNEKKLVYKKLEISPDFGFKFVTEDGAELMLTNLSSGEQQEVVLLYELLFRSQPETLVLIDEPEISLHVAWQKEVLQDLLKIIDLKNITVITATHSPQIIGNHWDLVVDLKENADEYKDPS